MPLCHYVLIKYYHIRRTGSVAEWSKALVLGTSHVDGVGSNPTAATQTSLCKHLTNLLKFNKLTSVFLCVRPFTDGKLRHKIVKVASGSAVETLTMLCRNLTSIGGLTSIYFLQ